MGATRTLILIADRNRLVAEALMDAFLEVADIDGHIATSLGQALLTAQSTRPSLILVDAWIARSRVEDVIRQLKEVSPDSSVHVVASHVDAAFERRVIGAGGAGSCVKDKVPAAAKSMLAGVGVRL